jgi:hypothetical protein
MLRYTVLYQPKNSRQFRSAMDIRRVMEQLEIYKSRLLLKGVIKEVLTQVSVLDSQ